ncbi:hypothetical protein BY996DRAFT_6501214 [Phakopsora pachyrhizi]|nr:hypothetical protein BY996DRAFT_6501214 [Phakopsora pachyrhizi]
MSATNSLHLMNWQEATHLYHFTASNDSFPKNLKHLKAEEGCDLRYRGMNKWAPAVHECDRAIALPLPLPSHFSIVTCLISSMANLKTSGSGTVSQLGTSSENRPLLSLAPGMRYGGISRHYIVHAGIGRVERLDDPEGLMPLRGLRYGSYVPMLAMRWLRSLQQHWDYYLLPAPYSLPSWKCLAEYRKLSDSESADCAPAQALSDRDTHLFAAF